MYTNVRYNEIVLCDRSVERECVSPLIELDPKDEAGGVPRIVFVGDSRIRQLYKALMHFMEDGSPPLQ